MHADGHFMHTQTRTLVVYQTAGDGSSQAVEGVVAAWPISGMTPSWLSIVIMS